MEKKYAIVLIIISLLAVCLSAFHIDNKLISLFDSETYVDVYYDETGIVKENGYYYSKYAKIKESDWNNYYSENTGFKNVYHFLYTVDNYVKKIVDLTGINDWQEIHRSKYNDNYYFDQYINIGFTENNDNVSDVSTYLKLTIFLNKNDFMFNYSTLAHDIAIIVADEGISPSLTEGFGYYIQDEIGQNINCFNFGTDIYTASKDYINEENKDIISSLGLGINKVFEDRKKEFNILSSSFVRFIIDNYGIENFMKLYHEKNIYAKINEICSKNLFDLKEEWINFIKDYDDYDDLASSMLNEKNTIKLVGNLSSYTEINGSLKNRRYFILQKSFEDYLNEKYGLEKYKTLVSSNYEYENVYDKRLTELKEEWINHLKSK